MANIKDETFWEKATRKTKQEPLVPIGIVATLFFLGSGFRSFLRGEKAKAQMLMRGRVMAQAFTVIAMGVGAYYGIKPDRPKNMEEKIDKQ
ncbi:hypothetical protein EON63_07845 [archaeon]|nr:MAG: hypothetical protein EON63_07845 [archaeon]